METDREYRRLMEQQDWGALCARAVRYAGVFLKTLGSNNVRYGTTAEDLGMEAIVRVASGRARWDPSRGAKLETYLYRVTRNLVLTHIRDNGKKVHVDVSPGEGESVDEELSRRRSDADVFPDNGPTPDKAWSETVVNVLIDQVEGDKVLGPMVEHIYDTGETKRREIARGIGVTPADVTNATKRLRRVARGIVDEHAEWDGARMPETSRSKRRST